MFKYWSYLNYFTNSNVGKILYFYIHRITTMLAQSQNIKRSTSLANLLYIFSPVFFAQACSVSGLNFSDKKTRLDQDQQLSFFFFLPLVTAVARGRSHQSWNVTKKTMLEWQDAQKYWANRDDHWIWWQMPGIVFISPFHFLHMITICYTDTTTCIPKI